MSLSRSIGSLVVRIVTDGLGAYKADLKVAEDATVQAASKIDKGAKVAGAAAGAMSGGMAEAATAAQELHGAAGLAGVGLGALAIGAAATAYAVYKGAQEQIEYQKALIMSGNAAGTNAGQMADMARNIGQTVGTTHDAAGALTAMASTGQVASADLQKTGQAAVQMQRTMGVSVQDTAKQFAELGQEPVKASIALNERLNYLTAATFEQIKAAEDMGDAERAASLAQNAYADAMLERTGKITESLGYLETAWRGVRDGAMEAINVMLGWGRDETLGEKIEAQRALVERMSAPGATGRRLGNLTHVYSEEEKAAERGKLAAMEGQVAQERAAGQAAAENAANQKLKIKWLQEGDHLLSGQAKLEKALATAAAEGMRLKNAGLLTQEQYEKRLNDVREKNAVRVPKSPKAAKTPQSEMDKAAGRGQNVWDDLMATDSGFAPNFSETVRDLAAAYQTSSMSAEMYGAALDALLAKQPGATKAAAAEAEALKGATLGYADLIDKRQKEVDAVQQQVDKERTEVEALGLSAEAVAALAAAKLRDTAASKDRLAMLIGDADAKMAQLYRDEAQALRDLADLKGQRAVKETELDVAKTLHEDVKGALSAAFRDSKDPIGAFGDALGNVIYTRMTNALADSLLNSLFGKAGSSGGGGLLSGLGLGSLLSFDGGGNTGNGARAGGLDSKGGFLAIMHPQETVVDHTKGQSAGGAVTNNNHYNFVVGDVASVSMVKQAIATSQRQVAAVYQRSAVYGS